MATKKVKEKASRVGFLVCAPNGEVYFVPNDLEGAPVRVTLVDKEECQASVQKVFNCLHQKGYDSDVVVLSGVGIKANSKPLSRRPVARRRTKKRP